MGTTTIVHWNCQGLRGRLGEFQHTLPRLNADIVCLQETLLSPTAEVNIPGYTFIRHDRKGPKQRTYGGGVATLIREGMAYSVESTADDPESICISIATSSGLALAITNVYDPPGRNGNRTTAYTKLLAARHGIVVGDFNAKENCSTDHKATYRYRDLQKALESSDYAVVSTGAGTHRSTRHPGVLTPLDIALASKSIANKSSWRVLPDDLGSDHHMAILTVNEPAHTEDSSKSRWLHKKANWVGFQNDCHTLFSDQQPCIAIQSEYDAVVRTILTAAERNIPRSRPGGRKRKVPYWTEACTAAIAARNRARNKMDRTKARADVEAFKQAKSSAQRTIRKAQTDYWQEYCASLSDSSKPAEVWKATKRMSGVADGRNIPSLKKADGLRLETNLEKAEHFASSYAKTSSDRNLSSETIRRREDKETSRSASAHQPSVYEHRQQRGQLRFQPAGVTVGNRALQE